MSVADKIKTENKEIIQPKKMGLLVENLYTNHLDILGVMMLG